jgi:hypothetical protein
MKEHIIHKQEVVILTSEKHMIRFRFQPRKALEAIRWMLCQATRTPYRGRSLDFHTILKSAYFADRKLLNEAGRPVFGADYRALNYGPVPVEIYEMLKCEPYWLSELDLDDYPWRREGYHVHLEELPANDMRYLSELDMQALEEGFNRAASMTFDERTRETHGMDWVRGLDRPGKRMDYADMIDPDNPRREDIIAELERLGPRIVL